MFEFNLLDVRFILLICFRTMEVWANLVEMSRVGQYRDQG